MDCCSVVPPSCIQKGLKIFKKTLHRRESRQHLKRSLKKRSLKKSLRMKLRSADGGYIFFFIILINLSLLILTRLFFTLGSLIKDLHPNHVLYQVNLKVLVGQNPEAAHGHWERSLQSRKRHPPRNWQANLQPLRRSLLQCLKQHL